MDLKDIDDTQKAHVEFPILGDQDRKVATLYDMIHPRQSDTLTVRSVFIIDPQKVIRTILTYPASAGRDFGEIFRVIDSLQLTDRHNRHARQLALRRRCGDLSCDHGQGRARRQMPQGLQGDPAPPARDAASRAVSG